jgi:hypothetical protein
MNDEEYVKQLQAGRERANGGGEFGTATAAVMFGDAVEYGPDDRFYFSLSDGVPTYWMIRPDGSRTALPNP